VVRYLIFTLTVFIFIVGITLAFLYTAYHSQPPAQQKEGCLITSDSRVFTLDWGSVVLQEVNDTKEVPLVKFIVDSQGKTNITVENVTAKVPVVVLKACSKDGELLWRMEFPSYLWAYEDSYGKENGTAVPKVLATHSYTYLYIIVYQTAPRAYQEFRAKAPNDYLYILGENGTVKVIDLGSNVVPIRNVFLTSNGNYVLIGFEKPQPDGSPYSGEIIILNKTEVLFRKTFFIKDPSCLCNIIPGWGRINRDGCAVFGLYNGRGEYCNGKFTYKER